MSFSLEDFKAQKAVFVGGLLISVFLFSFITLKCGNHHQLTVGEVFDCGLALKEKENLDLRITLKFQPSFFVEYITVSVLPQLNSCLKTPDRILFPIFLSTTIILA